MTIKPARHYESPTNINYDDINEGDLVIAKVTKFIPPDTMYLDVGGNLAEMDINAFYVHKNDNENVKLKKTVYASIGKKILARVVLRNDNYFILERTSILEETTEYLSKNIGTVVDATIETIAPFGLFVDIGNGIISLVPIVELSRCRNYNWKNSYYVGDTIKVKIMEYETETSMFSISRKQAYKKLRYDELPEGSSIIVTCADYVNEFKDGVYVEYNPNNAGIMDIPEEYSPEEFYFGRKIAIIIVSHKEAGFKARFVRFIS